MKDLFPGYYPSNSGDIDLSIEDSLVVFDANVLLNLYRFPAKASQDLLRIMEALHGRVWLPHHVALEYHRNRLAVVAEQKRRFREVTGVVDGVVATLEGELQKLQLQKRHSTIDPGAFLETVRTAVAEFRGQLTEQEAAFHDVTDDDDIRNRLATIFSDHVGTPPPDQSWISNLEKEGKDRYATKTPPGYLDQSKEGQSFVHRGLLYSREYGDLVLWEQLIAHQR
jgi:hypothetical protein